MASGIFAWQRKEWGVWKNGQSMGAGALAHGAGDKPAARRGRAAVRVGHVLPQHARLHARVGRRQCCVCRQPGAVESAKIQFILNPQDVPRRTLFMGVPVVHS